MKNLLILWVLSISLLLVGCWTQTNLPQESNQQLVANKQVKEAEDEKQWDELWMNIHVCLMWWWENCDEYLDPANKDKYADLVQEQCDIMPGMDACDVYFGTDEDHPHDGTEWENHHDGEWDDHAHDGSESAWHHDDSHGDLWEKFEWVSFSTDKEQTIDGYDITIKHKDDIHAGEKITWTVTVMQWGEKLWWFEKIDGDDWVGLAKHPDWTIDHLHPVAYTDNSLTFSVATEELWTYNLLTQFQHNGKVVNVPYAIELTARADDSHDH